MQDDHKMIARWPEDDNFMIDDKGRSRDDCKKIIDDWKMIIRWLQENHKMIERLS